MKNVKYFKMYIEKIEEELYKAIEEEIPDAGYYANEINKRLNRNSKDEFIKCMNSFSCSYYMKKLVDLLEGYGINTWEIAGFVEYLNSKEETKWLK